VVVGKGGRGLNGKNDIDSSLGPENGFFQIYSRSLIPADFIHSGFNCNLKRLILRVKGRKLTLPWVLKMFLFKIYLRS
jgi:hypothetical protein